MEQYLTYGLWGDELKHISQVENGLSCECVCPNCKHLLVAKNNPTNIKVSHFAHYSGKECAGAVETALHLLAKSILYKRKQLALPAYHYDYEPTNNKSLFIKSDLLLFDNIVIEKPVEILGERIIPDAIGEKDNRQLFIEFANTHFVDEEKRSKIKSGEIACIEIDLREQLLDETALTRFLDSDTISKYWISNPRLDKKYADYKKEQSEKRKQNAHTKKAAAEKEKQEANNKFHKYGNDKNVTLLKVYKGEITNCPKKKAKLNQLKHKNIYQHHVLKRIIDGEYWNLEVYGYIPNGKWIFLNQEKIIVYPQDSIFKKMNDQERKKRSQFFAGLQELRRSLNNQEFGVCGSCEFSINYFSLDDQEYEVCGYPKL